MSNYAIRGKLLTINLTDKTTSERFLQEEYYKKYLGGKALGTRLLLDDKLYSVDPLSSENKIFFLCGPLSGTMVPGSGKIVCLTKSPLTGIYLDSAVGGRLSHNIKMSGYDGIVLEGKSHKPAVLRIHNEKVEFVAAGDLWGEGCFSAEKKLKEQYGEGVSVGTIGPAGEQQVAFASFTVDFYHQAGRGGIGAVLGSKNVKAMVVSGDITMPVYDEKGLDDYVSRAMAAGKVDEKVTYRIKYGTMNTFNLTHKLGMTPVKNFTEGTTPDYESIKAEALREKYVVKDLACFACPMACGKASSFVFKCKEYILGGPEYESIALLGTNLGIKDPGLFYLSWLCDDLGMDTMSAGVVISTIIEGLEKGLIKAEDLGINLKWGDVDGVAELLNKMAKKEGLGAKMALGVKKFAAEYGLDEISKEVKGLELAAYDPRGSFGYALEMAVADRGGCHRRARPLYKEMQNPELLHKYDKKDELVVSLEDERAFYHSLVICDFIPPMWNLRVKEYGEVLKYLLGWEYSEKDMLDVGRRAFLHNRIFNLKCGIRKKDDTLPEYFFKSPMPEGPAKGVVIDKEKFHDLVEGYYSLRGWDREGVPQDKAFESLDVKKEEISHGCC